MKKKPLTGKSGEVRELTSEDMKRFRPAAEVLPQELLSGIAETKAGATGGAEDADEGTCNSSLQPRCSGVFSFYRSRLAGTHRCRAKRVGCAAWSGQ